MLVLLGCKNQSESLSFQTLFIFIYLFLFYLFIGPSYTNIRAPRHALNEGDLPPRVGAQTRPSRPLIPTKKLS